MKKINFDKFENLIERMIRNNDDMIQKTLSADSMVIRFKTIHPYYEDRIRFFPYSDDICIARYLDSKEDKIESKTIVDFKTGVTYILCKFSDDVLEKYRESAICEIFAQILYLLLNKEGYGEYNGKMSEKCQFCGLLFLKRKFSGDIDILPNEEINDVLDKILNHMCWIWTNKIINSSIRDELREEFYDMNYDELLTFLYLNEGRKIERDLSSI